MVDITSLVVSALYIPTLISQDGIFWVVPLFGSSITSFCGGPGERMAGDGWELLLLRLCLSLTGFCLSPSTT